MLEHQERELTPYKIADISYDLSVRDGILGLDQVKDSLRKIQPHQRLIHHIGVDYENWRLAITDTDWMLGLIDIRRDYNVDAVDTVTVDIVIGSRRKRLCSGGDGTINHMADDLYEMIQKALESLKINAISTTIYEGSRELGPERAGIHPAPSIPGYTLSHSSTYSPFVLRHTLVRTGGTP